MSTITVTTEPGEIIITTDGGIFARLCLADNSVTLWEAGAARFDGDSLIATATWSRSRLVNVQTFKQRWSAALADVEIAISRALKDPAILAAAGAHPAVVVAAGGRSTAGGPIGSEVGDANEHQALSELRKALDNVPWVRRVRRATHDEDQRGLDLVVETTDVGDLYVQVKTGAAAADTYRRKYKDSPLLARTVLVVMSVEREPGKRMARMRAELTRLHEAMGGKVVPSPQAPASRTVHQLVVSLLRDPSSASPEYIANLVEVQRLALARDEEKTKRMALSDDSQRTKEALRIAVTALRSHGDTATTAHVLRLTPWLEPRL